MRLLLVVALALISQCFVGADKALWRGRWSHRKPLFFSTKTPVVFFQRRGGGTEVNDASDPVAVGSPVADEVTALETSDRSGQNITDAISEVALDPNDKPADNLTKSSESMPRNLTFSATKSYDGSQSDPDHIPSRFLQMKKGDREAAKESFAATLAWREEFKVDTLLSRPHPRFDVCKALVPHYFSGRDPHGNIVFVQRPALLDFQLMRKNNATIDELMIHYIFVIEYCWNILEEGPTESFMTSVLDMTGLSFRKIKNKDYVGFGQRFVRMMSSHYPGRSYKTLIINSPSWFHVLYKMFKPMLRQATRDKIQILRAGAKQDMTLKSILGDSLPLDLLSENAKGTHAFGARFFSPVKKSEETSPGPNSLIEFEMRQLVIDQLKLHNLTLQEVFC